MHPHVGEEQLFLCFQAGWIDVEPAAKDICLLNAMAF